MLMSQWQRMKDNVVGRPTPRPRHGSNGSQHIGVCQQHSLGSTSRTRRIGEYRGGVFIKSRRFGDETFRQRFIKADDRCDRTSKGGTTRAVRERNDGAAVIDQMSELWRGQRRIDQDDNSARSKDCHVRNDKRQAVVPAQNGSIAWNEVSC
jgi:hypothetical protein